MNKEDKKFNLKGLLIVIIVVNVILAIAAYFIDLIFKKFHFLLKRVYLLIRFYGEFYE